MVLRKCAQPCFTYTDFPCYVSQTYNVIKTDRVDQLYLTGLLNSRVVSFWLKYKGKMQGHNYQLDKEPILSIPICVPSAAIQARIGGLVRRIIECRQNWAQARTSADQEKFARMSDQYDLSIQIAIEEIYGLSEDDRRTLYQLNEQVGADEAISIEAVN